MLTDEIDQDGDVSLVGPRLGVGMVLQVTSLGPIEFEGSEMNIRYDHIGNVLMTLLIYLCNRL